eukprot:TRINITY_DN475_c0_g1_i2.p2 TRINITY_DN475_c0_g1~~TRINITY_DN475_c0_g1_i2.p2  ORF type:complete len:152 (-),score=58.00 TRINITY_DN475_c0_g1_i2:21-476(-)
MEAKARGDFEILNKKAQGMKMMVDAAGGSKEAFQMLMLEHIDHLAETGAKAISNIKFDKIVVWDSGKGVNGSDGNATANFLKGIAGALPPTMHMMKDIGGVDLPKYFGSLVDENVDAVKNVKINNNSVPKNNVNVAEIVTKKSDGSYQKGK